MGHQNRDDEIPRCVRVASQASSSLITITPVCECVLPLLSRADPPRPTRKQTLRIVKLNTEVSNAKRSSPPLALSSLVDPLALSLVLCYLIHLN